MFLGCIFPKYSEAPLYAREQRLRKQEANYAVCGKTLSTSANNTETEKD